MAVMRAGKYRSGWAVRVMSVFAVMAVLGLQGVRAQSAQTFAGHDAASATRIDHTAFDALLRAHVVPAEAGLTRVDYAAFKAQSHDRLKAYIASLAGVDPNGLNRDEQFAYWANLYNALTLDVVLDHYPTASIRDIDISPGLADGPWGKKLIEVSGVALSLDDIEHGIMRPIWRDPRIHYAVNCASVGCPNLRRQAFTARALEEMLDAAARDYINSPRGVSVTSGVVAASSIFSWYRRDFGQTPKDVLDHIRRYAEPGLKAELAGTDYVSQFSYDWALNDVEAKGAN